MRLHQSGFVALLLAGLAAPAEAQLTIRLTAPATTPPDAAVYVAGSFNGWNPASSAYRLAMQGRGEYAITLPESVRGNVEFKFTLGSWDAVETDSAGADVPNRAFVVPATGAATLAASVPRFRDPSVPRQRSASTRTASVTVLTDSFPIPELGRTRRVWLYLPPDYATSAKRYPVIYMHDGQNLFDAATGYAGEWGVDETLDSLHAAGDWGAIIVGVDNGLERRLDEYSPWRNPQYSGGEGDEYVDFLAKTLKPWIDARYRTSPGAMNTGVAGSSMGGLISLYAALKYPEVFGLAAVFSPALWFADSIYTYARAARAGPDQRFYFVTGAMEGDNPAQYVHGQRAMIDSLAAAGFRVGWQVDSLIVADGRHAEWFWRREFPAAYLWLFSQHVITDGGNPRPEPTPTPAGPPDARAEPRKHRSQPAQRLQPPAVTTRR